MWIDKSEIFVSHIKIFVFFILVNQSHILP